MFKVTVIGEKFPIGQIKLKTLRRMLPKNFETSRVFKISEKKTILIEKGFGKPVLSELEAFLKVNTCRLLSLPSSHFVIYHNDHPAKDFGKDLMPIRLDRDTEPAKIRGQLYLSLFPEIKDEQFQDTTAMICFGKNPFKTPRELKSGVFAGILHETDQIEYYANKLKSAMRDIDTENIKMALKSLPRQILITQPLQNLAKLARIVIEHSKEEQLKVIVNRYHEGDQKTKLVEIFIIKKDYFGLSHDLTSILTSIDIEPLEMKFYPLRENKDTICRCVARFRSFPKTNLELQKEIEVLIEEDEARKTSLDEGGKIYFSYVNIFNAAARLLRSVDQSRNFYGIINVFQSEPEMVKNILTLLRKKADPAYLDEGLDPIEENKEIEKIRSALSKMPAEDSLKSSVLAFFLQFILSIKKTDYFDHNRIREMFTLYLDPSFLKDLLDPEGKLVSFPSDILVNYKTNTPFDVSLTFLTEKKTSGRRYTETKDVSKIQDLPLIETIKRKTVLHDSAFLSIAKKIFPDVSDMSSRSLELFQKIRFHHGFKDFGIASVLDYEYFVLASKALFHPVADDGIPHMEGIY
ncbi:MAG: hypothetical protein NT030_04415, partial [Candidatus Saganbacteria bacterium]|nr:hypothetical protein [Candidatus Saganbacteria bacterium]